MLMIYMLQRLHTFQGVPTHLRTVLYIHSPLGFTRFGLNTEKIAYHSNYPFPTDRVTHGVYT